MTVTKKAFRAAVYRALGLSIIGPALICMLLTGVPETGRIVAFIYPQLLAGYAAMVLAIEVVGIPLRSHLKNGWIGAGFGLALFLFGVLAGSATSMIIYQKFDPYAYIVTPLYWLGIYGLFPALIIGSIGSEILKKLVKNTGEKTTDNQPAKS